ncbi:hypothetical protein B566_EDAN002452 [Ephemera danica]|nr:hypothetical protein B566_EDAN002452 [Ephemera danica]
MVTLVNIRINSLDLVSQRASHRIKNTLVRITVFSLGVLGLCLLTIACHIYEYRHAESWHKALHDYVICNALGLSSPCLLSSHPSLSAVQLHLLAPFVFSALCASWLINSNSRATWIRVLGHRCPCCLAPPMHPNPRSLSHMASTEDGEVLERGATKGLTIQKRKVIARAFAKRKLLHKEGRLSICFGSSHGDPVGMAFDVDSAASTGGFSSAWAAAIPRLVSRRNALTVNGSVSSVRRNSIDSSFSMRSVSIESRRNSTDSQISLQISEFTAHHQTRSSRRSRSCHKHASRHRSRRHSRNTRVVPPCSRQASILQALQMAGPSGLTSAALSLAPNPQQLGARRAANAGIEGPSPTLLARLRLPGYSSHSDAEVEQIEMLALSRTSVTSKTDQEPTADASTHNGVEINSCDDSDTSSSSSLSSFSPELSMLTSHNSGVPTKTNPSAHHTSPKLNNPEDEDSSSPDEDAPFLPIVSNSKEFKRKSPSQASKASSCGPHKETREIGVQASLDLEEGLGVRKSGRRKKGLNNSYNAHRLVSELAAHQSSRSKSAGHC